MSEQRQDREAGRGRLEEFFCLTGCTAVGKTEWALRWAEENGAEIVNCDSLLFYRGMDIGTAKPTAEERSRVPHHLIDICEPSEPMDVGRFVDLAVEAMGAVQARGRKVLVTGGSGFYLKAFFDPVVDGVRVPEAIRLEVAQLISEGLVPALETLQRCNPEGLGGLDAQNPRRVAKALERCLASGRTLAELERDFKALSNPLVEAPKRLCILARAKEELAARIAVRVELMLGAGLLDEVELLLQAGIEGNPSACRAIGYRESIAYLRGEYDYATLREKIATHTRRLAKKQRAWFRGQLADRGRRLDLSEGQVPQLEALFGD